MTKTKKPVTVTKTKFGGYRVFDSIAKEQIGYCLDSKKEAKVIAGTLNKMYGYNQ